MIGPVITVPSFAMTKDGVDHFFGTKHSRVGATAGAASDLKNGRDARARLISVKQVHGTDVLILDRPVREGQSFDGAWDALMTNQPGIMVAVRTADCVPVLLHDPVRRIVAAVHAGWRGAVAGIVPNTIAAMNARFGGEAAALRMAIGPSVGACCYEVDEPVLSKLRHAFPDWQLVIEGEERALWPELIVHVLPTQRRASVSSWLAYFTSTAFEPPDRSGARVSRVSSPLQSPRRARAGGCS